MPLDPDIALILRGLESAPPMESLTIDALRASMVFPPSERRTAVGEVRDIDISAGPLTIPARLYKPRAGDLAAKGLLVYFHGGGFVMGSLETHDHICRDLCAGSGVAVLSVDYRLAPEHRFPAAPDDCLQAVRWAADNADALGIDASRIVVAGDSAGANLAAVTAMRLRDEGGPALRAQVLVYPVTDYHTPPTRSYIENQSGYSLTRAAMIRFWTDYIASESQAVHPLASPLRAATLAGLPPALVITAEFDPLRDEGELFAHRLLDAGGGVTLWRYDGLIHGFFRMGLASSRAKQAVERCAAWIRQAMA